MTRIYRIKFNIGQYTNGKFDRSYPDNVSLVAKDAEDAISKTKKYALQVYKPFTGEENEKVTYKDFDPTSVKLLAETN